MQTFLLLKVLYRNSFLPILNTHMKHPPNNDQLDLELDRNRAANHVRDAARLLTDVMDLVPFQDRAAYTQIVGGLNTIARQLGDLEMKL